MTISPNVTRHNASTTRPRRETLNGQKSVNLWSTDFSGSGKSTIAMSLRNGCSTYRAKESMSLMATTSGMSCAVTLASA